MKNVAIFIFLFALTAVAAAQSPRIGVVNEQEVLKEYAYAKEVQAKLETIVKGWQDTLLMMRDSLRKLQESYNATFDSTPLEIRKQQMAVIHDLEDAIDTYGYARGNEFDGGLFVKTKDEMYQPVIDKYRKIVAEIARREKVEIVYAQANLLVTGEVTDLTQKVIEALK